MTFMKPDSFVVCAYETGEPYSTAAMILKETCDILGLRTWIARPESTGDWSLNMCMRPQFVLDAMHVNPDNQLIVVDADCLFMSVPQLDAPIEFGIRKIEKSAGKVWRPGTFLIRNTPRTIDLCIRWRTRLAQKFDADPERWNRKGIGDSGPLARAWHSMRPEQRPFRVQLGAEWICKADPRFSLVYHYCIGARREAAIAQLKRGAKEFYRRNGAHLKSWKSLSVDSSAQTLIGS